MEPMALPRMRHEGVPGRLSATPGHTCHGAACAEVRVRVSFGWWWRALDVVPGVGDMTYQAGLHGFGCDREPTLLCDVVGCHCQMVVSPVRGGMPAWLRDKKAPKGWKRWPQPEDKPAQHTCPECTRALVSGGVDMRVWP